MPSPDGICSSCGKAKPVQHEGKLWEATIPGEWVVDEEESVNQDFYEKTIFKDKEGNIAAYIDISIEEDPSGFRDVLFQDGYGLNAYQNKEMENGFSLGNAYGMAYIDEVSGKGNGVYLREEAAAANVDIYFFEGMKTEEQEKFYETFQLKAKDMGNKDGPYHFDGKRYEGKASGTAELGGIKLSAEYIELAEPLASYSPFDMDGMISGDYAYIISGKKLFIYNRDDNMKLEKKVDYPRKIDHIEATKDGRVWVQGSYGETDVYDGLEVKNNYHIHKNILHIHNSGEWGITSKVRMDDIEKVHFNGDQFTTEAFRYVNQSGEQIQKQEEGTFILEDKIAVAGVKMEEDFKIIGLYDFEGKLLMELPGPEANAIVSVTGFVETEKAYIASDMTYKNFHIWNKEGKYQGDIKIDQMIQTNQIGDFNIKKTPAGDYYCTAIDQRKDKTSCEVLLYKLNIEE